MSLKELSETIGAELGLPPAKVKNVIIAYTRSVRASLEGSDRTIVPSLGSFVRKTNTKGEVFYSVRLSKPKTAP